MKKEFGVKSKYFSLLKAFVTECKHVGWCYHSRFSPLLKNEYENSPDLYFHVDWDEEGDFRFSLSNIPNDCGVVFNLPKEWKKALNHAQNCFNSFKSGGN